MTLAHAAIAAGASAPDLKLTKSTGRRIQLSSLWSRGPLVLDFLPPIGRPQGEDNAVRLRDGREAFASAGARLAAICRAPLAEAKAFDGQWSLGYDLLCDAKGAAFNAFGVSEEASGTFVIDTGGTLRYAYRRRDLDDNPSIWEVVDAVCALTGATVERPQLKPVRPAGAPAEQEAGRAALNAGTRLPLGDGALGFTCGRCGNTSYEVDVVSPVRGTLAQLFGVRARRFSAVSCTRCKYTELYKAEGSALANAFDILAGG